MMQMEAALSSTNWYAIHTQPKQENRAQVNLQAWGIETFYPQVRARRQNSFTGACMFMAKPLFSRYIFARFSADKLLHKVSFTRGVAKIVGSRNGPDLVDEEIIQILKSRVGKDGFIRMGEDLKRGDRVVIRDGLVKDLEGIFEREIRDTDRVKILLSAINYQASIVIPRDLVRRVA